VWLDEVIETPLAIRHCLHAWSLGYRQAVHITVEVISKVLITSEEEHGEDYLFNSHVA